MSSKLGVIDVDLVSMACFYAPFIFKIKVKSFGSLLLLSTTSVLLYKIFLDPSLEANMELPSTLFQLQSSEILLICALLIIKGEEETLNVHPLEVGLPVVHRRSRKVAMNLLLLTHQLLFLHALCKTYSIVYRKRTLYFHHILVLHQWKVYK